MCSGSLHSLSLERKKGENGVAGGFVTRAFESMLKECSEKKYPALQTAIQTYLDASKEGNQPKEANQAQTGDGSFRDSDTGVAKNGTDPDSSQTQIVDSAEHTARLVSTGATLTVALATATLLGL